MEPYGSLGDDDGREFPQYCSNVHILVAMSVSIAALPAVHNHNMRSPKAKCSPNSRHGGHAFSGRSSARGRLVAPFHRQRSHHGRGCRNGDRRLRGGGRGEDSRFRGRLAPDCCGRSHGCMGLANGAGKEKLDIHAYSPRECFMASLPGRAEDV